jgi:hypothetical protein
VDLDRAYFGESGARTAISGDYAGRRNRCSGIGTSGNFAAFHGRSAAKRNFSFGYGCRDCDWRRNWRDNHPEDRTGNRDRCAHRDGPDRRRAAYRRQNRFFASSAGNAGGS